MRGGDGILSSTEEAGDAPPGCRRSGLVQERRAAIPDPHQRRAAQSDGTGDEGGSRLRARFLTSLTWVMFLGNTEIDSAREVEIPTLGFRSVENPHFSQKRREMGHPISVAWVGRRPMTTGQALSQGTRRGWGSPRCMFSQGDDLMVSAESPALPLSQWTDSRVRWRRGLELFCLSFLALFLELMLIRWAPAVVRLIAYYANLILISSFLGLGVGAIVGKRRKSLFGWLPGLLLINILWLLIAHFITLPTTASESRSTHRGPQGPRCEGITAISLLRRTELHPSAINRFDRFPERCKCYRRR